MTAKTRRLREPIATGPHPGLGGALVIAGLFTLPTGRIMHAVVFGP